MNGLIKVMSFNLRYGRANDGDNHWLKRREFALERIKAFSPDLLGLQECLDEEAQCGYVREHLPGYHFHGIRRGGYGESEMEMAPLLFKTSTFELIEGGHFWLSETPNVPGSMSWGSAYPRTLSWVHLAHRVSGRELLYLNTHFDYEPSAIDGDAKLLCQWLAGRAQDTAVILTGDFNVSRDSSAYQQLSAAGLQDALTEFDADLADAPTYHGFGQPDEMAAIDWILVSPGLAIESAQIDGSRKGNLYPSDHHPILACLRW